MLAAGGEQQLLKRPEEERQVNKLTPPPWEPPQGLSTIASSSEKDSQYKSTSVVSELITCKTPTLGREWCVLSAVFGLLQRKERKGKQTELYWCYYYVFIYF